MRETERAIARETIGSDPLIAISSDIFGIVVEIQDVEGGTVKNAVEATLFNSPAHRSGPAYSVAQDGDHITVRFGRSADNYSNSEEWRYYHKIREILMGQASPHYSIARRIEVWLQDVVSIRMQDIPLGRVAID